MALLKKPYKITTTTEVELNDIDHVKEALESLGCIHPSFLNAILEGGSFTIKSTNEKGELIRTEILVERQK